MPQKTEHSGSLAEKNGAFWVTAPQTPPAARRDGAFWVISDR